MYKPVWHLKGKPYSVQVESLKRSHGSDRYGYWLEQGLGKTALLLNDWIENFSHIPTAIVICPNSFKIDWTLAPEEWGVGSIQTGMWPRDELRIGTPVNPFLYVINFEAVRSSGYGAIQKILDANDCLLVVDESSAIKNYKSQTAKAVLDLCKRAKAVRLLNGTPLVQNVMDLFPQLKCIGELDRMNPFVFKHRYAVTGGFMGKQIVGVKNEDELHRIQERCSFRALKTDWWAGCPEKILVPLNLEMTKRQRQHYEEMLEDFYTLVGQHEYKADLVLTQMDKLRQITSGLIMDGDKVSLIEPIEKNPKALAALDLMEAGSGKMIVAHFYTAMGRELLEFFKRKKLNPAYIRGGMKPEELKAQKDKFNNVQSCRILVGQIGATAMGHTLIAGEGDDRCHKLLFHDLTFSLRDYQQICDRIHRGSQDRGCLYFHPFMSAIDNSQFTALQKKTNLAAAVVDAVRALRKR